MTRIGRLFILETLVNAEVEEAFLRYGERGPCRCRRPGYDRQWPNHCRHCLKPHKRMWHRWKSDGLIDYKEEGDNET